MMLTRRLGEAAVGAILANFLYQLLPGHHHWGVALDRSVSQAGALLGAWVITRGQFMPVKGAPRRPTSSAA